MSSSSWPRVKLGAIAAVKGGKRMPHGTSLVAYKTAHPYIRVADFEKGRVNTSGLLYVTEDVFPRIKRYTISTSDIWISIVGTIGLVGVIEPELEGANLTENAAKICEISPQVSRDYLKFFLQSKLGQQQIFALTVGSTQPKLALFRIEEIEIPLPPKELQDAIVSILGTLDNKIELNRKMNETLEAMARATFKSWFIDFDPVRAKMVGRWKKGQSSPGLPAELFDLFPVDMENFEGREIPKAWTPVRVDSILTLSYGKSLPSEKRVKGNVPVYGSGGINGFHNSALVQNPTIIVGRKGTVGSLFWEDRPNFPIDTVFFVESKLSLSYLFFLLESLPLKDMNTDAAVPGLNRENVYRLLVPNPGPKLIEKFITFVDSIRCRIIQMQQETETLLNLKDSVLPRLISGDLQIDDPDKFLQGIPL